MTEVGEDVAWPDLRDGEVVASDDGGLLFRQVSPSFFVDGDKVSSQVFRPTRKDSGMLSTSRASVQTAEATHRFHTNVLGLRSAGVLGVTVAETTGAGARVVDDSKAPSGPPPPCPPGHAYVDFRPFGSAPDQADQRHAPRRGDDARMAVPASTRRARMMVGAATGPSPGRRPCCAATAGGRGCTEQPA